MTTLLLRDGMILTRDDAGAVIDHGYVLIRDSRIVAVGHGTYGGREAVDAVIECRDRLIAPGLINAHTHSQSSTMPGFGDALSHPAFMWLTQAHTSRRTPDEVRLAVLLAAYGMLTSGTTAAIDHFPGQRFTRDDMEIVLAAWQETGMRIALAMRFFDGPFSDIIPAGLSPELATRLDSIELLQPQPLAGLSDLMEDTIRAWHGKPRLSVFPAPSNPDRCSDAALTICAELAERYNTGVHTHLLETKKQAGLARARYGTTMVHHLDAIGVLSDRWSCAHSIWLDDDDIDLMASRGVTAVLNPESNDRIGAGQARVSALRSRGVPLALGTDGSGANDNLVMHEAMRAVAVMERADEPKRDRWVTADEVLRMATVGGARAMRQSGLGAVAPGALADLVVYRLDRPWWIPMNDPVRQLVFAETGASVEHVVVDGRVVLKNGMITCFDADNLMREIREMEKHLRTRNADLFALAHDIVETLP